MKASESKAVLTYVWIGVVLVVAQLAGQAAWNVVVKVLLTYDTAEGAK